MVQLQVKVLLPIARLWYRSRYRYYYVNVNVLLPASGLGSGIGTGVPGASRSIWISLLALCVFL